MLWADLRHLESCHLSARVLGLGANDWKISCFLEDGPVKEYLLPLQLT